jgi:predicted DNA-binding protein with PD1-like motif
LPGQPPDSTSPHVHLSTGAAITGDVYGHISPDVVRQAVEVLGDAIDR